MKEQMKEAHHQQLADALPEGVNWHDPLTPSIAQSIWQAALTANAKKIIQDDIAKGIHAHWSRFDISGNGKESAVPAQDKTQVLIEAVTEVLRVLESDCHAIVDVVWTTKNNNETLWEYLSGALEEATGIEYKQQEQLKLAIEQPAQEPVGEVQHYAAPANLPAYVNMKWYGKPPKNGTKLYANPPAQEATPTMSQFASKADYLAAIAEPVKQESKL